MENRRAEYLQLKQAHSISHPRRQLASTSIQ